MSCAPAWERASNALLPYFLSVFAALDPLWMVVGNALLVAVFGCVHYGVTAAYQRWRGVDAASAWAAMRFPSLTYVVAYVMHPGICVFSAFLLTMPDAQVLHYVIGAVGVLYGAAFPAGVCYFVLHHCDAEFKEYKEFSRKPLHKRLFYPVGYWYPAAQQRMYGGVFSHVRGGKAHMCVFQLLVLCVMGLFSALHPSVENCHVQYFCMAALQFLGAGVIAFTKMMRSAFLTVMHTAGFVLLGTLCIVNAANHLLPGDDAVRGHAAILLLLLCVVFAITVYSIVLWYVESRNWRALREQQKSPDYCLPDGKGEEEEEEEEEKRIESHSVSPKEPTL
ncbi:dispersed gene family protein 1 (DGF-1), putative [Trypanosoma cruzi marinkellei]|uniref:Dispersed gene family protein 1 (DGF-1), putative n=1 Tax=Trypanosoma cruzi marinkellei TaxID=85056 RepID=K2MK21_TRYCR|nr:dispersed gene family protein 1 (DGF-1), putative [Trypanosoma cruzi marinkellei]